jgi:hypothetical protein
VSDSGASATSTCTATDLRHEYASRLVERGVPLAQVRDLLSHASILTKSVTTTRDSKHFRQPSNGWKEARRSIRRPKLRTEFQESFKFPPSNASPMAKTPPRNPLQVTDSLRDGELVPVRGYAKGCSAEGIAFAGIAA